MNNLRSLLIYSAPLSRAARGLTWAALILLTIVGNAAQAQPPAIFSPVIVYRERYNPGRTFEMKEDGSGKVYLPQCLANSGCGDLSQSGVPGKRFFIKVEAAADGTQPNDIVVRPEDYSSRTVLFNDKTFNPGVPRWSPDGRRVAYYDWHCTQTNPDQSCAQSATGIVVADVVFDGSNAPVGLWNERELIVVNSPDSLFGLSWAPDNQRLAFAISKMITDPNGTSRWELHPYVAYAPLLSSSDLPTVTEIIFAGGTSEMPPIFSTISRTDSAGRQVFKLAFRRLTDTRPYSRYDIFTSEIRADYDGSTALTATRVTNATNAKIFWGASGINWSPDGQWLAYVAAPYGSSTYDIYKIRSDGATKAINLTNFKVAMDYIIDGWRK